MSVLTSRHNPLCLHLRKLAAQGSYRREAGEYLADGAKLWQEAVRWSAPITRVVTLPESGIDIPPGVEHVEVTPELMAYLSPMEAPQGVLFTAALREAEPPEAGERFLVLDGVQDPGNVGTIWRTADALGADGLILVNHCADRYNPKTVRATMGACFRLPAWECTPLEAAEFLKCKGLSLYAAALRGDELEVGRTDLGRCGVVIGNEGRGVSEGMLELCERTVRIPMRVRCESLNAAAAAAIVLWEMGRAR